MSGMGAVENYAVTVRVRSLPEGRLTIGPQLNKLPHRTSLSL